MCGIAGIISRNASHVSIDRLKKMTDTLVHRGPDGEGHWINMDGLAGFGSRRLAILDLTEAGSQPFHYMERYVIVHNGEIYNYKELHTDLGKKGYSFRSGTDTEVIAATYDHYGPECVDQLEGMFAFAIWDQKTNSLFAARDRFGEKPFFYHKNKDQFVFASEMKAFWSSGIEKKPNLRLLFNYFTIGYVDNPSIPGETFYENISKLPAASFLTYNLNEGINIERYWDIDVMDVDEKISDDEAIEEFNLLLTDSVKKRYRSDVKIGTSLSGGLDSSTVVAVSNELQAQSDSHKAFTAIFPGFDKDESAFAKKIASQFSLEHYTVQPDVNSLIADFDKLVYHQEEPFASASCFAQYKVYERAIRNGVKVLLDGQGSDETLAGYHKYYKWYWQELYRKRRLSPSKELQYAAEIGVKEKFGWKNRVASIAPEFASIFLERQYLLNALKHDDLTKEFVQLQSKEAYYSTPNIFSLNGALYFNTCMHGLEELLRYGDRNSMAHGCEVRLPFLNHELVEFVFSLPSHFKIRKGWTKWILRKAMDKKLPAEITWRKDKIGYEPPQFLWMQDKRIIEKIQEAKKKLVSEKILKPEVMDKPPIPSESYDGENYDWRYLTAAALFK